jgi:gas vesicle protein
MKELLYFVFGAAIGALAALLFAPKSGTELRGDIQQRANADLQKLQQTYEQSMAEMNKKMEQIQAQLKKNQQMGQELVEELKADETEAPEAPAAPAA